jgi:hypothetical protein
MRIRIPPRFGALVLALLICPETGSNASANKVAVPPPAKALIGVWIGFNSSNLTFTRLDLRADSTGFCALVSPASSVPRDKRVSIFRVEKWSVNGGNIEIQMSPLSNGAKVDYVRGYVNLSAIRLTMSFFSIRLSERGPKKPRTWKEQFLLHSGSEIMSANHETKDEIAKLEKN